MVDNLLPPPPPGAFRILEIAPGSWFRVHPYDTETGKYGATDFNDSGLGNARFSPLINPATGKSIPTLYASSNIHGAISEVVLHDVPTPSIGYLHDLQRDLSKTLHVSQIALGKLMLANLTATGMKAAGLGPYALVAGEKPGYPLTRQWALWIWKNVPDAQGLFWMSRRDNRHQVLMLFGDRVVPDDLREISKRPLAHYEDVIVELLAEMGAGVIPGI